MPLRVADFTDAQDALGMAIQDWLDARPGQFFPPSRIARGIKHANSYEVAQVADAMEAAVFIRGTGNGGWHKYASRHRV